MSTPVETTRHGQVALVTLRRPDVRNAVDADTARQLHAAFVAFEADESARVAVFHGDHGHFCAVRVGTCRPAQKWRRTAVAQAS